MKAVIIGQDYLFTLEEKNKELTSLKKGVRLEGVLVGGEVSESLDKKVILEKTAESDNPDGINVEYLPKTRNGWADIREIRISLNQFALEQIELFGRFGTRYDGSNMIEIYAR